jgi:hypothetical protein
MCSNESLTGTGLEGRVTCTINERKVTPLGVTRQEESSMETRLHVSTATECIQENVLTSLVINVVGRGMPHVIMVGRLFSTHVELRATFELIVQVLIMPPMLTKGKEPVPPRTTLVFL